MTEFTLSYVLYVLLKIIKPKIIKPKIIKPKINPSNNKQRGCVYETTVYPSCCDTDDRAANCPGANRKSTTGHRPVHQPGRRHKLSAGRTSGRCDRRGVGCRTAIAYRAGGGGCP